MTDLRSTFALAGTLARSLSFAAVIALLAAAACAHRQKSNGAEGARSVADLFHHRARWKDYGGAALLVVPEKRANFEEQRRLLNDDKDLSIADYQLDELTLSEDTLWARVVSKVSWHRLPSATQHDDTVVTELHWRDGAWYVARQQKGPFDEELSGPYEPPSLDAGTATARP